MSEENLKENLKSKADKVFELVENWDPNKEIIESNDILIQCFNDLSDDEKCFKHEKQLDAIADRITKYKENADKDTNIYEFSLAFRKEMDIVTIDNIEYPMSLDSCLIHSSEREMERRKDVIFYCFLKLSQDEQEKIRQKNCKNLVEYYLVYHRELQIKKSTDRLNNYLKTLSDVERQAIFKKRNSYGLCLIHCATRKRCTHLLNILKSFRANFYERDANDNLPLVYYFNKPEGDDSPMESIETFLDDINTNGVITFNGLFRHFLTDIFEETGEESLLIKAVQYRCNMNIIECLIIIMRNIISEDEFFHWLQMRDEQGRTALCLSIRNLQKTISMYLFDLIKERNDNYILEMITDHDRCTPFHFKFDKLSARDIQEYKELFNMIYKKYELIVDWKDNNNKRIIHYGLFESDIFRYLLNIGFELTSEMEYPLIFSLAEVKNMDSIKIYFAGLSAYSPDVFFNEILRIDEKNGYSVVHYAVDNKNPYLINYLIENEIIKELLDNIDDSIFWMFLNTENIKGELAVETAVKYGKSSNVDYLLEIIFEKSVFSVDNSCYFLLVKILNQSWGTNIVYEAIRRNYPFVLKVLLKYDIHSNGLVDLKRGTNILDYAIDNKLKEHVQILLESNKWASFLRHYYTYEVNIFPFFNQTHVSSPFKKLVRTMPDMARLVLDKCVVKPSDSEEYEEETLFEMSKKINIPKNYGMSKNLHPKSIKFHLMKKRDVNYNFNATVSCDGRERLVKPLYSLKCDCSNHEKLELYNFEFITDSFYDEHHAKISQRIMKDHPLYLMADYGRKELIEHKLTRKLFAFHRKEYLRQFLGFLLYYILYLGLFTSFLLTSSSPVFQNYERINATNKIEFFCSKDKGTWIIMVILYMIIGISLLAEIMQMIDLRKRIGREREDIVHFPVSSYIIFIGFLIVMPIIVMNLLTALAVENVKHLKEVTYFASKKLEVAMCNESEFYRQRNFFGRVLNWLRRNFERKNCLLNRRNSRIDSKTGDVYSKVQYEDETDSKHFNFYYKIKCREEFQNFFNFTSSFMGISLYSSWAVECTEHNCIEDKTNSRKNYKIMKEEKTVKKEDLTLMEETILQLKNSIKEVEQNHKKSINDIKKNIYIIKDLLVEKFKES
ncbi:DgyrCDS13981 [Dimorphilus gyrociliatus]|uniref:DgyrCDS13981 n=1 Tax=Dimorphilus gyrociliatus TaxID=2664684 RepID=A0A7I8WCF0_9ANNE|nr:DgyrCDS13981 [Dimorphilus gyrociliatus]